MLKKGFTLVELLAVIAILGIILTLTVPKIVDVVNESKMNTFKADVKLVLQKLNSEKMKDETFDFTDVTLDVLSQNLGIRTNNYKSIKIKDVVGKPFIILEGKDKWDGYTAYGVYENAKVVLSNTFTENTTAPTITLVGGEAIDLSFGATYTEQGITYSDDVDTANILSKTIIVQGEVNTQKYGTYLITYYVYDSSGNVSSIVRTVNVVNFTMECLVVAGGGGGGGGYEGGGGGGGGVVYNAAYAASSGTTISVAVGSGGLGVKSGVYPTNGGNSSFGYITAIGGGFGAHESHAWGLTQGSSRIGGSGGGGSHGAPTIIGAPGTAGQGSYGGNGWSATNQYVGGGGGGAGGNGGAATATNGGNGGIGYLSTINGISTYYGGGGGGSFRAGGIQGTGGLGGGGNANGTAAGLSGTANTGGGGGAGGSATGVSAGGDGGSGIVIIAYKGTTPRATGGTISTTSRPGYVVHTFTSSGTLTVN